MPNQFPGGEEAEAAIGQVNGRIFWQTGQLPSIGATDVHGIRIQAFA